jgi:class 3 adenylate cyclase
MALAVLLETARVAAAVAGSDELTAPIRAVELSFFASGVIAQIYRYRRASTPTQRQQTKWFIVGGLIILASLSVALVQGLVPEAGIPGTAASYAFLLLYTCVLSVGAAAASLAIAFGVLKYRLFDVDVVINRGALYATAAILLIAMFGLIGSALEQALGPALRQQTDVLRVLTAIALAPAFAPLQRRLRPLIDQLLPANEPLALMFADIVGSTEVAVALGDESWRQMLASYYTTVRRELRAHAGTEVDTAGDGVFATFRSPTDALRCALALPPAVRRSGLRTRIGLHYGLCDMRGEKPSGRNVIIAARIMAVADADTILMSSDERDAISSPDLVVESLGDRSLKGIPAPIALYRATM